MSGNPNEAPDTADVVALPPRIYGGAPASRAADFSLQLLLMHRAGTDVRPR